MAGPSNAAEMELLNNITSAEARKNFDRWFKEDRAKEINDRWAIRRKFLDAKGDDPSLASRYVLVDVLETPGDHKKLKEILTAQIEKKGHTEGDKIWVQIRGCNYVSTEPVCKDLVEFQNIEKLSLGDAIEPDDAGLVGDMIEAMPNLTALDLANNKLETEGLQKVLASLAKHQGLIDVDLSGCGIGHSCGKHLAAYLAGNTPVQRLLLNGNKLGIYGVQDLSKGLVANTHLETLGLFFNNMGEEGMNHLLNVLREAHAVQDDDNPPASTEAPKKCECPPPTEGAEGGDSEKPADGAAVDDAASPAAEGDGAKKEDADKDKTKDAEKKEAGEKSPAAGATPGGKPAASGDAVKEGEAAEADAAPADDTCGACKLPKKLLRTAKNTTLVSCTTEENKNTPEQINELERILAVNAAEAQERELEKLRLEELARLEQLAKEKKEEEERLAREAAEKAAAEAAEKAAAKKGAAKPGAKAAGKAAAKPAAKKGAAKPAAKSALPAIKKK